MRFVLGVGVIKNSMKPSCFPMLWHNCEPIKKTRALNSKKTPLYPPNYFWPNFGQNHAF